MTTAYAVVNAAIEGDGGDDTIAISAESLQVGQALFNNQIGYGVFESSVNGGDGDDRITATGTTFAIQDALITGGRGADFFDTGIGSGKIDGGAGEDYIQLNFFDATTMTLTLLGSGVIEISGSVDGLGKANAWTQQILNVEQFEINSQSFNAEQLAKRFAI
jgi:hypothetical protein